MRSSKQSIGPVRSVNKPGRFLRAENPYVNEHKSNDNEKTTIFRITVSNDLPSATNNSADTSSTSIVGQKRPSVFSRLSDSSAPVTSGTAIMFENLNASIVEDDIRELCLSVGEVKSLTVIAFPGSSLKSAEVVFSRRSVALECIKKFHAVKLDGLSMTVKLKGESGKENPFNPFDLTSSESKNVRMGLFGTAFEAEDDVDEAPTKKAYHKLQTIIYHDSDLVKHEPHRKQHASERQFKPKQHQQHRRKAGDRRGLSLDSSSKLDSELDSYMNK